MTFATGTEVCVHLVPIHCGKCGGTYGINQRFHAECKEFSLSWTCPYCRCGWGFSGKTEAQQLKEQLEAKERELGYARSNAAYHRERREAAEHSNRALRGVVTKKRKQLARVQNGVCPCCNRHFANLERHMTTKHPTATPKD